jgi:hypothetical protein
MVPMNWGVYDSSGKLRRRFRSCAAAHRWLIREGLEWSAWEIRTLKGEEIMNPFRPLEAQVSTSVR